MFTHFNVRPSNSIFALQTMVAVMLFLRFEAESTVLSNYIKLKYLQRIERQQITILRKREGFLPTLCGGPYTILRKRKGLLAMLYREPWLTLVQYHSTIRTCTKVHEGSIKALRLRLSYDFSQYITLEILQPYPLLQRYPM
jgi:hypothetical protein